MDPNQLNQLLQALNRIQVVPPAAPAQHGGTRKLSTLSSVDGAEWRVWRRAFEQTALINNWNDLRSRREVYAGMEGEAARNTQDLLPVNFADVAAMLAAFEARFVPAADTKLSRAQFESARQLPSEMMTAWHSRLRELYIRAFPGQDVENSPLLIDQFIKRLYDRKVAEWVINASPITYAQALATAQNVLANQMFLNGQKTDGQNQGAHSKGGINALMDGEEPTIDEMEVNLINANATCWFCKKTGHVRDDCREFLKMLEYFAKLFGVKPSQYKSAKGRNRKEKDFKSGKSRKQKKKVQAIVEMENKSNTEN